MFMSVLDPVTLLTALAGATTRIGLVGTVSTSFSEPHDVARPFALPDQISAGRAGLNVITSANDYAARKFGHPSHKAFFDGIMKIIREENPTLRQLYLRYERARKTIKRTPTHIAEDRKSVV